MVEWNNLAWIDLPAYSVSDEGDVRNDASLRNLAQSVTASGVRKVSLNDSDGKRRTLGVAHLVATNFVEGETTTFDTVINLDGDRSNNRAENLMWRPRWFAVAYHRQFSRVPVGGHCVCFDTEEIFPRPIDAAMKYGLMEIDIVQSCFRTEEVAYRGQSGVWPTGYEFMWLKE